MSHICYIHNLLTFAFSHYRTTTDSRCHSETSAVSDSEPLGELSHVDPKSNTPKMVDVSDKQVTKRTAHARSIVRLPKAVLDCLQRDTRVAGEGGEVKEEERQRVRGDITTPKGPVLATAIIAGTMAVKRTSELIPFCHPLPIEKCNITTTIEGDLVVIDCVVGVHHKTGVEMEALTGVSVAALCVYDMCKALSHDIVIEKTYLVSKTGGKSDFASSH